MTDKITLKTDGYELSGFDDVKVKNRIDWLAGYFDLTATNKASAALKKAKAHIRKGADCSLTVDGKKAFTGYIDKVVKGYLGGVPYLRVVGFSQAGDLIDSDLTGKTYKNQSAKQILTDILTGFKVSLKGDLTGEPLDVFTVNPAEKCVSAIERLLDRTNGVLFSQKDGSLCLTGRDKSVPANVQIITGKSDVVAASRIDDDAGDFSKIVLIGQNGLEDEHDIMSICAPVLEKSVSSKRNKQKVVFTDNVTQARLDKEFAKCGKAEKKISIIGKIEQTPHKIYAEPFVGMGGVFLRRTQIPKAEVINDINGELVNLYRIVRKHPEELCRCVEFRLAARQEFYRLKQTPPETLTEIERAVRFLYLQSVAFGGKLTHQAFGVSIDRPARFNFVKIKDRLRAVAERLASVTIEQEDFEAFIRHYDTKDTLFYLDPPYWGNETDYGKGIFRRSDFERLKDVLTGIKGRFILSLNDVPQVRDLFKAFTIEQADVTYSINNESAKHTSELIISN